jgi:folate-binding protein YgfZ
MIHVFNPQNSAPKSLQTKTLPRWCWITLQGKDAKDFLHRLSSAQVKFLQLGQGAPGCFLSPQGKIRAYFHLWNYAENEYGFELDSGDGYWKNELLTFIEQYTFSEKFVLTDTQAGSPTETLEARWIFLEEGESLPEDFPQSENQTVATSENIRICHHGKKDYGRNWLTAWGKGTALESWISTRFPTAASLDYSQLEKWRIHSLRPRVGAELTENSMPVEIGISDAVAENKGCYPGQEVIEKIISLGSPPKRLAQITGEGMAPKVGDLIFNLAEPPIEVGQVTSVAEEDQNFIALGLIRKIHAKEGLSVRFTQSPNPIEGKILKIAPYEA